MPRLCLRVKQFTPFCIQVLSSKLMPTTQEAGAQQSARRFCEDFLNAGGLHLVVNVLQREAIPLDVDYEIRQGCYAIALQLLRYRGILL